MKTGSTNVYVDVTLSHLHVGLAGEMLCTRVARYRAPHCFNHGLHLRRAQNSTSGGGDPECPMHRGSV